MAACCAAGTECREALLHGHGIFHLATGKLCFFGQAQCSLVWDGCLRPSPARNIVQRMAQKSPLGGQDGPDPAPNHAPGDPRVSLPASAAKKDGRELPAAEVAQIKARVKALPPRPGPSTWPLPEWMIPIELPSSDLPTSTATQPSTDPRGTSARSRASGSRQRLKRIGRGRAKKPRRRRTRGSGHSAKVPAALDKHLPDRLADPAFLVANKRFQTEMEAPC